MAAQGDESTSNQSKVSLTIAKYLFSKESDKNIMFSPLSLQVVLSILAAGSEGATQQQLLDFLQFESTDHLNSFVSYLLSVILKDATRSRGPCLSFANSMWLDKTLSPQPSFKHIVSTDYKATLSSVDFQNKMLKDLGVSLPFSSGGLTKMMDSFEGQNCSVTNIFHKSFIEVNEKGIIVVAASAEFEAIGISKGGVDFIADHPFLFLIREDLTQTVLFARQVLNPLF